MKKILLGLLLTIVGFMATGCSSCQSENKQQDAPAQEQPEAGYDGIVQDFTAGVDHIVALHRQEMFNLYDGEKYVWYETRVLFSDSLKWETIDSVKVVDVTDIFQLFSPARCQYISTNIEKGTIIPKPIPDIWIEDCDMSNAAINLWPEDVIEKLKAWDGIIPPAAGMTLRIPLGPRRCNAQWVIGNIFNVIFVDAVTGEITDWCPAFPIPNVAGPLGEWP